ncbi:MAG TPA: lysylphosphatidylglycerol synthase transmembrane domain-containing protein [Candidatus Dormibacteraeota bacterium]|nr:lysylphosphatidylglycerol synthase transmembrane domain-containing protein [Candidatus Dormibacteraeota bacterium]
MRGKLKTAAKLAVSVGLLGWVVHKAGLRSIADTLAHASVGWLALAIALGFAATCVQATQWHALLLAHGMRRTWWRCLRLVFVGNTFNSILPSSIGGDVARAMMVADTPAERVPAASSVVLQRLCNFPGMMVLMGLGVILTLGDSRASEIRLVAIAGVLLGAAGLALCMTPLLGRIASLPLLQRGRPGRIVARLLAALDAFRGRRTELVLASVRGTAFWGLSVLNQWAFIHAVGASISLAYAAIIVTTINALTMLPISINGYGIRENGFSRWLAPLFGSGTAAAQTAARTGTAVGFLLAAQSLLWAGIGVVFWLTDKRHAEAAAAAKAATATEELPVETTEPPAGDVSERIAS